MKEVTQAQFAEATLSRTDLICAPRSLGDGRYAADYCLREGGDLIGFKEPQHQAPDKSVEVKYFLAG
jgi:hypothetical protein